MLKIKWNSVAIVGEILHQSDSLFYLVHFPIPNEMDHSIFQDEWIASGRDFPLSSFLPIGMESYYGTFH